MHTGACYNLHMDYEDTRNVMEGLRYTNATLAQRFLIEQPIVLKASRMLTTTGMARATTRTHAWKCTL